MQQLLVSWLLVGVLLLPADQVGLLQAVIGVPGVLLMLLGGANADSADPRSLLVRIYLIAPIFPALLHTPTADPIQGCLLGWHGIRRHHAHGQPPQPLPLGCNPARASQ